MAVRNLTVRQAARLLGKSEQFVRIGMQRGLLDIGTVLKTKSKNTIFSYHISIAKFMAYSGYTMEEIEADYTANGK